MTHSQTEASR